MKESGHYMVRRARTGRTRGRGCSCRRGPRVGRRCLAPVRRPPVARGSARSVGPLAPQLHTNNWPPAHGVCLGLGTPVSKQRLRPRTTGGWTRQVLRRRFRWCLSDLAPMSAARCLGIALRVPVVCLREAKFLAGVCGMIRLSVLRAVPPCPGCGPGTARRAGRASE